MELQFQKAQLRCLRPLTTQVQTAEQVHQLRLPDGMPDIGSVLGAWGQVLLRGKEWDRESFGVSGGVMVWAMYEPEEGGEPRMAEAWLPFQMKWDIPPTGHDGKIRCSFRLKNVDARSTSARKLMLRANVSALGEAYVPEEVSYYTPEAVPEDVQLLRNTYPLRTAVEAGEKTVELDEEMELPGSAPKLQKLLRFSLQPELIDRRVMADKVVFRGSALARILYTGEDGHLHTWQFDVPFSQYAELDGEYGPEAEATVIPELTGLEMEQQEDGRLLLKGGMTCQYVIYDRHMLELVQDAYSPNRQVTAQEDTVTVPTVLDQTSKTLPVEATAETEWTDAVDTVFYPRFPEYRPENAAMHLQGRFHVLCYDDSGRLRSHSPKWEQEVPMELGQQGRIQGWATNTGIPQATLAGQELTARADLLLDTMTTVQETIPMLSGLTMGEPTEPDPGRPSIILRKPCGESLWQLAKRCGSTPDRIRQANALEGEPQTEDFLLIPVL